MDYDSINFESIITEDKLDDFINHYINRELNRHKFEVTNIKKHDGFVDIHVMYDSYVVGEQKFPMSNSVIGFQYQILELDKINNF